MIVMAIDGAARRNGKPDCLSAGSVFIKHAEQTAVKLTVERNSTNQRGELNAMVIALGTGLTMCRNGYSDQVYLITDSEYIYNALSKEWYINWQIKNWITSTGEPVKNRDIWELAADFLNSYKNEGFELITYHIKGHLASIGKVTAAAIIRSDPTGAKLFKAAKEKVTGEYHMKADKFNAAKELFERNHGHTLPETVFLHMAACNLVADCYAGYYADIEDAAWER